MSRGMWRRRILRKTATWRAMRIREPNLWPRMGRHPIPASVAGLVSVRFYDGERVLLGGAP